MIRQLLLLLSFLCPAICIAQPYSGISFYVVAHQEDWQCFMGRNAWSEMHMSQKKVVVINITAGNWTTSYLAGCCKVDCDSFSVSDSSYYFATESAERKSIDLAASATRQKCSNVTSPYNLTSGKTSVGKTEVRTIRGSRVHNVSVYSNDNVVCYFLRLDEEGLTNYYRSPANGAIFAVDGSSVYTDFNDLAKTIAGIYQYELLHDLDETYDGPYINTFDDNLSSNPMDHIMHYYAKTIAYAACDQYKHCPRVRWNFNLYEGLHLKDELPDLSAADETPEIQAKAALYAVWCIGMLNSNAQVGWGYFPTAGYSGTDFQDKEYSVHLEQEMGRCKNRAGAEDEKKSINSYPNPVNEQLTVEFDTGCNDGFICIADLNGRQMYRRTGISEARCYDINTTSFAEGPYILTAGSSERLQFKTLIIIHH